MHWLGEAAARAGMKGANTVLIPLASSTAEAWEILSRGLSTTSTDLARQVAHTFGVHAATFSTAEPKALRLLPEKLARRYNVFPLRETDRQITVATSDPRNIECEQAIEFAAGRRVVFELTPPHLIRQAIERAYTSDRMSETLLSRLDADLATAVKVIEDLKSDALAALDLEAAPVVKLTNLILRDAVLQRASDVHVEPGEGSGVVRFRVDGVMRQHMQLPMAAFNRVVSRIKILSRLDIADRMRPQDGRSRLEIAGQQVDLRVSTVPIGDAEKVVIRVLRPDTNNSLDDVGLAPAELKRVRKLLSHRDGIVLVTGPTGSGKTTTMYAALRELANSGDVNIMTVEDPVEYQLPGIAQIQTDAKRGVTFASALRAILRQDPDVIFVGEIRDLETAEIAVQAAMTGHLVLATLHTNDAVSAVARLMDLGLDRAALAATIRGALAQRLVRRICGECNAVGCERCSHSGYFGRLPINEVAVFTPQMTEHVTKGASTSALQAAAIAGGMRTLHMTAAERVANGETTEAEQERVVGLGDTPLSADAVTAGAIADAPGAAAAPVAATTTVLVVDDDAMQRLVVSAALEKGGYRVSQASDGAEALRRILDGEECALLVTDLHMTQLDGDALIRRLRADPRTVALPIVVLTGSDQADKETELFELGADDYLRKPVDPTRLLARVRAVLRRAA